MSDMGPAAADSAASAEEVEEHVHETEPQAPAACVIGAHIGVLPLLIAAPPVAQLRDQILVGVIGRLHIRRDRGIFKGLRVIAQTGVRDRTVIVPERAVVLDTVQDIDRLVIAPVVDIVGSADYYTDTGR